jgi:predicted esterase
MKNPSKVWVLGLIAVFAFNGSACVFADIGTITSGGRTRTFVFHAPATTELQQLPLLFVFHGDGSNGEEIRATTGFDAIADAGGFLAVYPNADTEGWNEAIDQTKDTQFVSDMIDFFCAAYHINTGRVYSTGVSAGGFMTYNLAVNLPDKVAAFAPISGNMYATNNNFSYFSGASFKPVPICHIHGMLDTQVPYPDPNNQPDAWQEWPLTQFSYYSCNKTTYTLPGVTLAAGVTKSVFCAGTPPSGKEISLIGVAGKAHESLVVPGFNPYQSAWDFVKNYSIVSTQTCDVMAGQIYTQGRYIHGSCNNVFVPKGVNYSLADDWEFPDNINGDPTHVNDELSAEIIKAKPNTVRIQWYANRASGWKPYSIADLDVVISRFKSAGIVSVIELHDVTCSNDYAKFNSVILPWWKQQAVLDLLEKHKGFVIANVANEFGNVQWTSDAVVAYNVWLSHYMNAITELRTAGVAVPLMIDAPDCGQNLDAALQAGNALRQHDPQHNVIMSAHAYWYQADAAEMNNRVQRMASATFPILLGEVANKQDDGSPCTYDITSYTDLLTKCQQNDIGWLAWTWTDDWCSERRVAPGGSFSALSTYGNAIVNHADFGLATHAQKISVLCPSDPLPVVLGFFKAYSDTEGHVQVLWETASETMFSYFEAERSVDGRRFSMLGSVASNTLGKYVFKDHPSVAQTYYYRIKMIDLDGSFSYSKMIAVEVVSTGKTVIYPSPASGLLRIETENPHFPQLVTLFDAGGREVLSRTLHSSTESIDISGLPRGIYSVVLDSRSIGKVVVEK